MHGTITSFAADRGFGVITSDDGDEFFFHRNALTATDFEDLAEGVTVEFQVKNDQPGDERGERPRAVNVRLAADAIPAVDNEPLLPEKVR
jgi:cold shock protein